MKKVFLALALVATVMVSCKKAETAAPETAPESTTETVVEDTTAVETEPTTLDTVSTSEHE